MASDHVLIFGHSHANCVAAALRSPANEHDRDTQFEMVTYGSAGLPGALVVADANGRDIINPILLKALDSRKTMDPEGRIWLVSMVAGNYAAELSMFSSGKQWTTLLPKEDAGAETQEAGFVHYDALQMTLDNKLGHFRRFISALPMARLAGFIHVEAPPPVRDPVYILKKLPEKSRDLAMKAGIGDLGIGNISDAEYRKKVWICQSEVIRRAVEGERRYYLAPPSKAMDEDGFIVERLRQDPTHANHEYGGMVLEHVADFVASKRAL